MLAHADRLTADPGALEPAHLKLLGDAGLSPQAIVALSRLAGDLGIAEAEINPLIVRAEGAGVVAVDALVKLAANG